MNIRYVVHELAIHAVTLVLNLHSTVRFTSYIAMYVGIKYSSNDYNHVHVCNTKKTQLRKRNWIVI